MKTRYSLLAAVVIFLSAAMLSPSTSAQNARVQLINGSVDPMMETVDVYLDDVLWYDDFEYATAKAFTDVLAGTRQVALAPASSASSAEAFKTLEMWLLSGQTYHAVLSGVLDPGQYDANPDGIDTSLKLFLGIGAHETSSKIDEFEYRSFHNLMTEGELNFWVDEGSGDYLVAGGSYGTFSNSGSHRPIAGATGYIKDSDDNTLFFAEGAVSGLEGKAFLELSVGFRCGPLGYPELQWLRIFPDGLVQPLVITVQICPSTATETVSVLPSGFRVLGNYPNPFNPVTVVEFELAFGAQVRVDLYDVLGRRVLQVPEQSFGTGSGQQIRIDASDLGSGTYLYRVIARSGSTVYADGGRMILLK